MLDPKEFHLLLLNINLAIKQLKKAGISIKDIENQDWRLKNIEYDSDKDQVYFKCEEDK